MEDRVLIDCLRPVALAVAAHVRSHSVEAGFGQRGELMAPGIPGFRESVTQDYRRPVALLGDIEADTIALDDSLHRSAHVFLPLHRPRARVSAASDPFENDHRRRARQ